MLKESLLPGQKSKRTPRSLARHASDAAKVVSTAVFLSVLNAVNATSFGLLMVPEELGMPYSPGVPMFLMSTIAAQIAMSLCSRVTFAMGGAVIDSSHSGANGAAGGRSWCPRRPRWWSVAGTSVLIGLAYLGVSRLGLGRIFRCIPLIVLNVAHRDGFSSSWSLPRWASAWKQEAPLREQLTDEGDARYRRDDRSLSGLAFVSRAVAVCHPRLSRERRLLVGVLRALGLLVLGEVVL